jgi:2-polyprenyl-3-methyl-5-hydroxy-6-metoxy-1,4-benzoquinol methylase
MPLNLEMLENAKKSLTKAEINRLNLYVNEANFFYSVICDDLNLPNRTFYEIGSGIGLLSRMVAEQGHRVVATEPAYTGFEIVNSLQKVISQCFDSYGAKPVFHSASAEDLNHLLDAESMKFDYIFCANVVEHVVDLPNFFASTIPLISENGKFRFICPNYAFPYEPHFGFLTLFSKRLTLLFQKRKILKSDISSPLKFYDDLSFPTHKKIKKILYRTDIEFEFQREATEKYIMRIKKDLYFSSRKKIVSMIAITLSKPLNIFLKVFPKYLLPIIDCKISKVR